MSIKTTTQIEGTPERIENSNGTAIKFRDGTMICTKIMSMTISTAVTGNIFYKNFTAAELGDWAVPFVDANIVPSLVIKSGVMAWCGNMTPSATQIGPTGICTQSQLTNAAVTLRFMAIGRWK